MIGFEATANTLVAFVGGAFGGAVSASWRTRRDRAAITRRLPSGSVAAEEFGESSGRWSERSDGDVDASWLIGNKRRLLSELHARRIAKP